MPKPEKHRRRQSSSIFDNFEKSEEPSIFSRKLHLSNTQVTIGTIIGIVLTLVTIALHCVAYLTPHWKEVSPITHSVYVDGIDALIRTQLLIYFNTAHRFTRQSYGLFQRCEYLATNVTKVHPEYSENHSNDLNFHLKKCTKNFLPTFGDEKFNECHSLPYYRFCSKNNGKIFDVKNDLLRATYGIISHSDGGGSLSSSCVCYYPEYISVCQAFGIIAFICLSLTVTFYGLFPFLKSHHTRLKYKCLCLLFWLLAVLFLLINILVVKSYLEYESLEFVAAIERHYHSSQIYTLSEDAKKAMNRFRSSIRIETGYSTKLAWISFILSLIDGVLIMLTCEVSHFEENPVLEFTAIPHDEASDYQNADPKYNLSEAQLRSRQLSSASLVFTPISPSQDGSLTTIPNNNAGEQSQRLTCSRPSCLKGASTTRIHFEDEV